MRIHAHANSSALETTRVGMRKDPSCKDGTRKGDVWMEHCAEELAELRTGGVLYADFSPLF